MIGTYVGVLTRHRQTQRQIARALHSAGFTVQFLSDTEQLKSWSAGQAPDLLVLDCDDENLQMVEATLRAHADSARRAPIVLLSMAANKGPLMELLQRHEVSNLVAKHGAIRAVYPVLDERELLVTCEKVIRRNIFGIDKYISSWGVEIHRAVVQSLRDKGPVLQKFEDFLRALDCPSSIIPDVVTVADELILNAVVHAPLDTDGNPKYEAAGPSAELKLEPKEFVDVTWGCDGQRLMLSVADNFGRLRKETLHSYLARTFSPQLAEPEGKPSGAGLGLSLSFRTVHQLIFNVHENRRTEAIAGWYLRVTSGIEFRRVSKSLNLFWLPADGAPASDFSRPGAVYGPSGVLDENLELALPSATRVIDLRGIRSVTSRGLNRWMSFVKPLAGHGLEVRGCPESFVRAASTVLGVFEGMAVQTVLAPYECPACQTEEEQELTLQESANPPTLRCSRCGAMANFAALQEEYAAFVRSVSGEG